MKKNSARTLTFLSLVLVGIAGSLHAQISYVSVGPNGTFQLRQMNAGGSGDTQIGVPFANPGFPTWSRDGALLSFTAFEASLTGLHTQNVYSVSRATGAVQKLTNYLDILDPLNVALSYTFPYYKAFSPDRSALATFSLTQTGGGGNGVVELPVLEIHSLTATANPIQVHTDKGRNGRHHGGEGVDWSPAQNVLAAPLESSTSFLSGGGPGETTAIFLIDPVNAAVLQGRARQVTFPRADADITTGLFWTEHDYQPKFSPNGVGLAYVRSFQAHALLTSLVPNPDIQSLHILNVNTGADTLVTTFPSGRYVSSLDWSPDGTQLVFDLGVQVDSGVVGLLQRAAPETNQIYVVNVNGTGVTQLRGNGNGTPSWSRTSTSSQPITLGNISTRMRVGSGDNAMIGGFIISGSQSKKVIIRGIGPSLAAVGLQGVLTDPFLELHDGSNAIIATNDNWQQAPNTNEIPSGFAPGDPRESVIVTTLAPGNYTAVIKGAHGETGVGVVETYDLTQSASSKLANISTRGFVDTGDNAMIGGLIMTGGSAKVLVRALGPSLANFGIANTLQDPTLELINGNGTSVATNDNWQQAANTSEIPNGFTPSDSRESAIVTTIFAGNYTAIVRGKGTAVGVALVEAYNLQ
jgi:hypothetical protein